MAIVRERKESGMTEILARAEGGTKLSLTEMGKPVRGGSVVGKKHQELSFGNVQV